MKSTNKKLLFYIILWVILLILSFFLYTYSPTRFISIFFTIVWMYITSGLIMYFYEYLSRKHMKKHAPQLYEAYMKYVEEKRKFYEESRKRKS